MGCRVARTLGQLGEIAGGATPSTKKPSYWNGDIPWLSPKDLTNYAFRYIGHGERSITRSGYDNSSTVLLPAGTVLFSSRAPIGYVAIASNPVCTNQGFKSVVPYDGTDSLFLYYLLKFNRDRIEGLGSGTTFKEVSATTMRGIEVDVPRTIDEQRRIASVLDSIDSKIEANARLNGYLEELARAMYMSAMQEHADSAALRDLAEFNPETYSPKENWNAASYIDTSALNNLAGLQHFNLAEEKLPARARRKVSNGDILYSTVRPNQNHYGLLYGPEPHMLASTAFAVIRPNDTIMSPLVYLALTDARITKTLQQLAETSTSTIPSIRPVDLERIAVLVPSDECGNEIAAQIGTAFKQIDCNKRENRKLATLRDALLPKLMSGEIDVSEVDLTQLNSHLSKCSSGPCCILPVMAALSATKWRISTKQSMMRTLASIAVSLRNTADSIEASCSVNIRGI